MNLSNFFTKRKKYPMFFSVILGVIICSSNITAITNQNSSPLSCTIVTLSIEDSILFGNNEDYSLKGTGIWFTPSESGYGAVFFGYLGNWHLVDRFAQGGMNEMGLCCDANALPAASINRKPDLKRAPMDFFPNIMEECANVNETIEWFLTHNFGSKARGQYHFADANGDAVIVSAGVNGEWVFTINNESNYLLSTNFNVINPENGWYPCWRYDTADEMLNEFTNEDNVTISNLAEVMEATVQGGTYRTQYTNIFNPKTREVYIWHQGDFTKNYTFNLNEELINLTRTVFHKIPVLLGEPDWFFPPQFPTIVVIGLGVFSILAFGIFMLIRRLRKKKIQNKKDKE